MHRLVLLAFLLRLIAVVVCAEPANERVPVRLLAKHYGFPQIREDRAGARLESQWTVMDFRAQSRRLLFNETLLWMHAPLLREGETWSLSAVDANRTIAPLLSAPDTLAGRRVLNIVLDAGHGGDDSGARGRRTQEKEVVLELARRIRKRLRRRRFAVRLTRTDDYALELAARTDRARRWHADLLISLHLNSATNPNAVGVETYCLTAPGCASTNGGRADRRRCPGNAFDRENLLLAYNIHREVLGTTASADRGVRRARFAVLRNAPCPAILVECGFISNEAEERRMGGWRFQRSAAEGIVRGILKFAELGSHARARDLETGFR